MKVGFFSINPRQRGVVKTGQTSQYGSGTGLDDGFYQKGVSKSYTILNTGQYAGTTNIVVNSKTDVHSNVCVQDNVTGLMWLQSVAGSVGPSSDGKLPWTTTGSGATAEGIFDYCIAANAALLSGYSDWYIPNVDELHTLINYQTNPPSPDVTTFPSFPQAAIWTSTTDSGTTANGVVIRCATQSGGVFVVSSIVKTSPRNLILVRGGQ